MQFVQLHVVFAAGQLREYIQMVTQIFPLKFGQWTSPQIFVAVKMTVVFAWTMPCPNITGPYPLSFDGILVSLSNLLCCLCRRRGCMTDHERRGHGLGNPGIDHSNQTRQRGDSGIRDDCRIRLCRRQEHQGQKRTREETNECQ
jgi:hypothetical protein